MRGRVPSPTHSVAPIRLRPWSRVGVGLALAALVTTVERPAGADEKADCIHAGERAQRSRMDGKLPQARSDLLICSRPTCPAVVRQDCSVWLSEVTQLMPSVVIVAKDARGADLTAVSVRLDGAVIADQLDGKAISVPVGRHTLRAEHPGFKPVEVSLLIREGEKARSVEVRFEPEGGSAQAEGGGGGVRAVLPWVVVGVGGAALVTGAVVSFVGLKKIPDQCNFSTQSCEPKTPDDVRQSAESGHALVLGGLVTAGAGLLVGVGGLVWHFLDPADAKTSGRVYFTPIWSAGGGGSAAPAGHAGAAVGGVF